MEFSKDDCLPQVMQCLAHSRDNYRRKSKALTSCWQPSWFLWCYMPCNAHTVLYGYCLLRRPCSLCSCALTKLYALFPLCCTLNQLSDLYDLKSSSNTCWLLWYKKATNVGLPCLFQREVESGRF